MFLSAGASVAILLLGAVAAAVALVLHARLQSELIEISARHRQASEQFKRVHADAAAIRGEAEKMASKLTVTREYLGSELTKALAPPTKRPARRGG